MLYAYTIFYVKDVGATIQFYEQAFGFKKKFVTPEGDYGELNTGATVLAFASIELGKTNFNKGYKPIGSEESPVGVELAFVTDQIESDFNKAIGNGAIVYEAIVQKPWGQKVGYLRDPNGILIEICTPIKS